MVKQTVVHPFDGILLSNEKEKLLIQVTQMDLNGVILGEKKPVLKGYLLHDSIYVAFMK